VIHGGELRELIWREHNLTAIDSRLEALRGRAGGWHWSTTKAMLPLELALVARSSARTEWRPLEPKRVRAFVSLRADSPGGASASTSSLAIAHTLCKHVRCGGAPGSVAIPFNGAEGAHVGLRRDPRHGARPLGSGRERDAERGNAGGQAAALWVWRTIAAHVPLAG
jgi:hypothetical protein